MTSSQLRRSADAARNRWASLVKRMPLLEKNHEYDAGLAQAEGALTLAITMNSSKTVSAL